MNEVKFDLGNVIVCRERKRFARKALTEAISAILNKGRLFTKYGNHLIVPSHNPLFQ